MDLLSFAEIRLIIAKSTNNNNKNNIYYPYPSTRTRAVGTKSKFISYRISLIKTLKTYVKKYCKNSDKYNVLYLSIFYLDVILSKNKINLSSDKNLKYICLCCFLLSLKFIGNYDTSKKVISNFCKNYKDEYKIFEIQCLILLEHNLVYTTTFDYLNMILINEPKILMNECNEILYQICEDNIYTFFSPFYIAIAIFNIAKCNMNYDIYYEGHNHNHYEKYFRDERVKVLIKKINYLVNPPPSIKKDDININSNNDNNILNKFNKTITNTNTNINIISNNRIHNNIVIINAICKQKSDNYFPHFRNNINANTPNKVDFKNKNYSDNKNNNYNYNYINKEDSDNTSKSQFKLCRINKNNIYNNHKTITIKEIKNKNKNKKEINSSFNYLKCEKKSFEIKKELCYNKREESFSTDIQTPNQLINNKMNSNKRIFSTNKSSLNFQIVSGVSKEKLYKLSRNLSKSLIKLSEKSNQKGKLLNNF